MTNIVHCPGCGRSLRARKGLFSHLKTTTNTACRQAYRELFGIHADDTNTSSATFIASDDEDMLPRGEIEMQNVGNPIDDDLDMQDADFFGSFDNIENIDDSIEFEMNLEDVDFGLEVLPDLEHEESEDSDNEEDEYFWYVRSVFFLFIKIICV